MATKKPTGTQIVSWQAEMAARATKLAKAESIVSGFKRLGTRGGVLTVDDTPVKGNSLRVVVVAAVREYAYYEGKYDAQNPQPPSCYAFADPEEVEEQDMKPHEAVESKQSHGCLSCWANEFGSADTGRGKACKNTRRLAVVTEDSFESAAALEAAEVRSITLPVTSVKNWGKFVNKLATDMELPYYAVVCNLSLVPDAVKQFQVVFEFCETVEFTAETYEAFKELSSKAMTELMRPYPTVEEMEKNGVRNLKPTGKLAQRMSAPTKSAPTKSAPTKSVPTKRGKF
jgi:hypothetical protein